MPLMRYFLVVGGALLALLFITDAYLPKLPAAERADTDLPVIRIHSDRKWPERVVFDTSRPIVAAAPTAAAMPAAVADLSAKARVREAFAQLLPTPEAQRQPPEQKQAQLSTPAKSDPKPHKRKIAKRRPAPPPTPPVMLVAQQPQFGFFGRSTW
jgi:hypothetical protein